MEDNYMVYMHISPSNKRYIGITQQEPNKRWANGKGYGYNSYFTNAINKYGWDNFQHIIIAKGLDEETAKWLEIELIREGAKNPNARKIICVTTNEIFETITEGAKKYNCNRSHISSCCNGKYKYCGRHPITGEKLIWMYYDKYLKSLVDKR